MTTVMPFVCSICEEQSTRICVRCTKDTCSNHLCEKCGACSDCCDCEVHLDREADAPYLMQHDLMQDDAIAEEGPPDPDEPRPHPMPDPDPAPEPDPSFNPVRGQAKQF
jgi:hypothetical protein